MVQGMAKRIVLALVLGMFCLNNSSYARLEKKHEDNKYPDYSYEYNGEDKFEKFNRKMFNFNIKVNKYVVKPVNIVWASVVPRCAMERIKSCYTNIEYPKRMVSSIVQRDFKSTGTETARFLINSTIGLGGMFDPAKSKFNIQPVQKDMDQAFSKCHVKKGPYLVLPFAPPDNVRGYVGKVFDCGLNPATYLFGVGPMIAKAGVMTNKTSYSQGLISSLDVFADPYDVARKLYGIDNYLKNTNIETKEVMAKIVNAKDFEYNYNLEQKMPMKSDMEFKDYEPQGPVVDSMRTAFFEMPKSKKSMWHELSVWNRTFDEKIKNANVNIDPSRENYKFRYILQKNKNAPIAIVYPSIGEGSFSHHPVVFAKMFYDAGYSVVIQGSPFHWQFIKSVGNDYRPGLPQRDAQYTRLVTGKILKNLEVKENIAPCGKIIVGTSYGGLTTLFVAAQEEETNTLNISRYISISPPVDLVYAMRKLDSYSDECNKRGSELQEKTALAADKMLQVQKAMKDKKNDDDIPTLSLTEEEGVVAVNFIMRQKLSDVVFTLEGASKTKKSDIYKQINGMSFNDYIENYVAKNVNKPINELNYEMSLYSIGKFLSTSGKYKIYTARDDYFLTERQLNWLKGIAPNKVVLLQNGSHLGFLYRKEFQESLKKDIFSFMVSL